MYRLSVDGWTFSLSKTFDGLFTDPDNMYFRNPNVKIPCWNQMIVYWKRSARYRWVPIYEYYLGTRKRQRGVKWKSDEVL